MPILNSILIFFIIVGSIITIISFFIPNNQKVAQTNINDSEKLLSLDESLNKTVDDADNALENLNDMSKHIFNEFNDKYQEFLFLYQMLDDKKNEVATLYNRRVTYDDDGQEAKVPQTASEFASSNQNSNLKHVLPRYNEIITLTDKGMSVAEIAKNLGMGQGEVNFILQLGKKR